MNKTILIAGLAVLAGAANAVVMYDSQGFEPRTLGLLVPQDGWANFGTNTANVVGVDGGITPHGGNKQVRMTASNLASTGRWAYRDFQTAWNNRGAGQNVLNWVSWINIPTGNTRDAVYGVQIYQNGGNDVITEFSVRPSANYVAAFGDTAGHSYGLGTSWKGTWHKMEQFIDFDNLKVVSYFDGIRLLDETITAATALGGVNEIDLMAYNVTAATTTPATVYFDDVYVQAVPEPTSMVALALGGVALVARRRRK